MRLKYIEETKPSDLNAVMLGINSMGKLVIYSKVVTRETNAEVSKVFGTDFEVIEYSNVYDDVF